MQYLFAILVCLLVNLQVEAQQKLNPEINPYGQIFTVPGVSIKADKSIAYNVVAEVDKSDTLSGEINNPFEVVARMVNLLSFDGISKDQRSIVVIFHNAGAYCVQNDETYQRKYGRPNPNTEVINQLAAAGVQFVVCGQSTVRRKIAPSELLPTVKIATSFLTAYTTFQLKGYAALKL